jgi:hypothetical protein
MADSLAAAIGCSSERRVHRWLKVSWYDDRGSIQTTTEGPVFVGRRGVLNLSRVNEVEAVGPIIPWAAFASLLLGNLIVVAIAWAGAFNFLTVQSPQMYIFLGALDVIVPLTWPMNWVKVELLDDRQRPLIAYFTVDSTAATLSGGGKRLHTQIKGFMTQP